VPGFQAGDYPPHRQPRWRDATIKGRTEELLPIVQKITRHLQKEHKLVTKGYYLGIGMAMGIAIGAAADSTGMGLPIGIAVGLAIGRTLDDKANKEGRVI